VSTTLPDMRRELDRLAGDIVGRVNELHRQGTNARGETGVDFFDPAGVTATSIGLSAAVSESSNAIAAGRGSGSGDNTLALDMAALGEEDRPGLDGRTFGSFYAVFVSALGRSTRDAAQDESAATALLDNAESWRQGVSGVSVEEEMVQLISQQEAYTAAARLVSVADGMVQEILRLGQ
jgi:flagellar hook-associated protein 1 FlgK